MFQPAQISVKKCPQIWHAIFQHRQAVNAHAKGETLIFFAINTGVLQNRWMHHATAADFHPIIALADNQLIAVAPTLHVNFHTRLSEGEIARAQANSDIINLKKRGQKCLQSPFQMPHMGAFIDH